MAEEPAVPVEIVAPSPTPVEIVSPKPVPVIVKGGGGPPGRQSQQHDPSLPANTTFQQDLTFEGQRQINLIWERTQAVIALFIVIITMVSSVVGMIYNYPIPNLIATAFGMVTGFYFSRTNHQAIGGIGNKPIEKYTGR